MKHARHATKSVHAAQATWGGLQDRLRVFRGNNSALPADRFRAIGRFDTALPLAAREARRTVIR
jgi:hypothetical protein